MESEIRGLMKTRTRIALLIILAVAGIFCVAAANASAEGYTWEEKEGSHIMKNEGGEVVKEWDETEWDAWEKEVNENSACMGLAEECADKILAPDTPVEGATQASAEESQKAIQSMRSEGIKLDPETTKTMLQVGEDASEIPKATDEVNWLNRAVTGTGLEEGAGLTVPTLAVAGGALVVGLEIGNELDQLWHLPDLTELLEETKEESAEEAKTKEAEEGGTVSCTGGTNPSYVQTTYDFNTEVEHKQTIEMQPGCYLTFSGEKRCGGSVPFCVQDEVVSTAGFYGKPAGVIREPGSTPSPGSSTAGHWTYESYRYSTIDYDCISGEGEPVCHNPGGYGGPKEDGEEFEEDKVLRFVPEAKHCEYQNCMEPLGVPAPNVITPQIEGNNQKAGMQPRPVFPTPVALPNKGPERLTKEKVKEITETPNQEPRKRDEKEGDPSKQKEEEEKKPLTIPLWLPNESGTAYKKKVEEAGFTSPTPEEYTVPEAAANPNVGPEDVVVVTPNEGTRAAPTTQVRIGVNPKNVTGPKSGGEKEPVGPGETGGKQAGPSVPEIKWPHVATPCNVFPFGVPCWFADMMKSLILPMEAPKFSFEILGKPVVINLAAGESGAEIIRPALVFVSLAGILFFYFSFAGKGGPGTLGRFDAEGTQGELF